MMATPLKITQDGQIFRYLHVHAAAGERTVAGSNRQLQLYLSLARSVSSGLDTYIAISFSPYVEEVASNYEFASRCFDLSANDFFGIGIDHGFQQTQVRQTVFPLQDLMTLLNFPEDSLGDKASALSVFLLRKERKTDLLAFLNTSGLAGPEDLLRPGEKFAHLTCGKVQGYFDALVMYSHGDISHDLLAFIDHHQSGELL